LTLTIAKTVYYFGFEGIEKQFFPLFLYQYKQINLPLDDLLAKWTVFSVVSSGSYMYRQNIQNI
jgi:hypothetical protein